MDVGMQGQPVASPIVSPMLSPVEAAASSREAEAEDEEKVEYASSDDELLLPPLSPLPLHRSQQALLRPQPPVPVADPAQVQSPPRMCQLQQWRQHLLQLAASSPPPPLPSSSPAS